MKSKKGILIGVGSFIIIAIIVVLCLFLHRTSNIDQTINLDLNGKWRIISKVGEYVEDEVIVFQNGQFSDYRDGSTSPNIESSYILTNDRLELKDISKVYYIAEKTDNYLVFIDDSDKSEWKVIRYSEKNVSVDWILGDWNVIMHGDTLSADEKVVFDKDTIKDLKNGSTEPSISSAYSWKNDKSIYVDALNMDVYLYYIDDNTLVMRQGQDGYVWELQKL